MITTFLRQFMLGALCALLFVLGGCNQNDMLQKLASPAEQTLAKRYIDLLRQQHFDDVEKAADASFADAGLHSRLAAMAGFVPAGEPKSITLVGAHRLVMDDATTVNTTYEYAFADRLLLFNIALKSKGDKTTIVGFNMVPQHQSLTEQNRFTLEGKAPMLYAISLTVVFLCLAALYESWSIPFAVMLVVPLGIIGTILATLWRGLGNDVFFQVGLLTTVGLSAKNAILIVEFAEGAERRGMKSYEAALEGDRKSVV